MGFAESFAECMQGAQIQIDASAVTDEESFPEAINHVKTWFDGLPSDTKEGLDEASATGEPVAAYSWASPAGGGSPVGAMGLSRSASPVPPSGPGR